MDENTLIKDEFSETSNKKTKHSLWIIAPIAVVAAVVLGIVAMMALRMAGVVNPYEKGYIDITGRTAGDIAKEKHFKYEKFLDEYGLPKDMPKSTSETAMFYNMPVKVFVKKTPGVESFDELKADMGWDDSITEDTTFGDALDKTQLKYYVGEEQLERFKQEYNLPDITGETLYGEIRNIVDDQKKRNHDANGDN